MMKKVILLLAACVAAVVVLWLQPWDTSVESTSAPVETHAQYESDLTTVDSPRVERRLAAVARRLPVVREDSFKEVEEQGEEAKEEEALLITVERSTAKYPTESDGDYELRIRLLRLFDQFVESASLTDEEIASLKVAVYDAQSEFAEIQRRPYVYVNRRRPKPPDWVVEASDDAEMLRREFLRDVSQIVGKDRAILLDHTFVTTLEILPFRVFIKPGYAPIALIAEQPF